MLTIRLQRVGKSKAPTYRLVISEKTKDTQNICLENLGNFNPRAKENKFVPKIERIKYWLEKGAQTSNTVNNLLINAGIMSGKKKKSVYLSEARKKKLSEKKKSVAPKAAPVAESVASAVEPVVPAQA